jgi:hypothetical protein
MCFLLFCRKQLLPIMSARNGVPNMFPIDLQIRGERVDTKMNGTSVLKGNE